MAALSGASVLKCDGTFRHACTVMPDTSRTQSAANRPSSQARALDDSRRYEEIQVIEMRLIPNDRPKVTGLRHDSGPNRGLGSMMNPPRCSTPETTSTTPMR